MATDYTIPKDEYRALLAENRQLRKENDTLCRRIDELCRENEKLMGELAEWERLAAGIELPEYPITQFQPKDLEREIAELREFAEQYAFYKEVEKGIHPDLKAHEEVLRRFAATLGAGTCQRVLYKPTGVLVCSECGAGIPKQLDKYCYLHFCPNCGRKVVDE